jgi:hypothetical protein
MILLKFQAGTLKAAINWFGQRKGPKIIIENSLMEALPFILENRPPLTNWEKKQ